MKRCFKCLCELPMTEFYKHSAMSDGHLNKCKACTKKDVLEHRLKNLDRVRAYDRLRATEPKRMANNSRVTAAWRKSDPRRSAAHNAVARALRKGQLQKWPCEVCGDDKSHAHHPTYDAPLLVTWLCAPHHKEAHLLTAEAA